MFVTGLLDDWAGAAAELVPSMPLQEERDGERASCACEESGVVEFDQAVAESEFWI